MLELTTRFSGITTSPKAAHGLAPAAAAGKAKANLRYISRISALFPDPEHGRLHYANLSRPDGTACQTRADVLSSLRTAIDDRAAKGGKNGIRVAEKFIFSLPNDFGPEASNDAIARVIRRLANGSEEVKALGVNHRDKAKNNHAHILLIDGLETEKQARKRRPDAKRVRRADVVRMGDMGRPREVRALIAQAINEVAKERGLSMVEHRSFEDRGLEIQPTRHEGTRPRRADPIRRKNAEIRRMRAAGADAEGSRTPSQTVAKTGAERARPQASAPRSPQIEQPATIHIPVPKRKRRREIER